MEDAIFQKIEYFLSRQTFNVRDNLDAYLKICIWHELTDVEKIYSPRILPDINQKSDAINIDVDGLPALCSHILLQAYSKSISQQQFDFMCIIIMYEGSNKEIARARGIDPTDIILMQNLRQQKSRRIIHFVYWIVEKWVKDGSISILETDKTILKQVLIGQRNLEDFFPSTDPNYERVKTHITNCRRWLKVDLDFPTPGWFV